MRPATALVLACCCVVVVACSGGTTSVGGDGGVQPLVEGGAGDSGVTGATPQTILNAKLVLGANPAATCPKAGAATTIGSFEPVRPVKSGATEGGGAVSVTCSVVDGAGSFKVSALVDQSGSQGGSLALTATTDAGGSTKMGTVIFGVQGAAFRATSCVLDPFVRSIAGISAGRYWVGFKCAAAQSDPLAGPQEVCDIEGELRVENCAQ